MSQQIPQIPNFITIQVDQLTLQTIQMGLASLQINTVLAQNSITAQINASIALANAMANPAPKPSPPEEPKTDANWQPGDDIPRDPIDFSEIGDDDLGEHPEDDVYS